MIVLNGKGEPAQVSYRSSRQLVVPAQIKFIGTVTDLLNREHSAKVWPLIFRDDKLSTR